MNVYEYNFPDIIFNINKTTSRSIVLRMYTDYVQIVISFLLKTFGNDIFYKSKVNNVTHNDKVFKIWNGSVSKRNLIFNYVLSRLPLSVCVPYIYWKIKYQLGQKFLLPDTIYIHPLVDKNIMVCTVMRRFW